MSSTVFVLGAGASRECGAPLMYDFLDTAFDLWRSGSLSNSDKDHFERVYQAIGVLQKVNAKSVLDTINVESVFTALEMAKILGGLGHYSSDQVNEIIKSLKRLIVVTLESKILYSIHKKQIIMPATPYGHFANLLKDLRTKVNPRHILLPIN